MQSSEPDCIPQQKGVENMKMLITGNINGNSDSRRYCLIGIGFSAYCPLDRQFRNRIYAIIRRDKAENISHIDNCFSGYGHEFSYHGKRFMIEYGYHEFGYQAKVYSCEESQYHDLRT